MQVADHILIPLLDGRRALAQVVQVHNSRIALYLTDHPYGDDTRTFALDPKNIVAVIATETATLTTDQWLIIGYESIPPLSEAPLDLASEDANILDPAIVEAFANAVHGLYPWDGFPDPAFFSNLLRSPETLPTNARFSTDFPTTDQA